MRKPIWMLSTLAFLLIVMVNGPAKAALAGLTDNQPTINPYECIDENGDEQCDAQPED